MKVTINTHVLNGRIDSNRSKLSEVIAKMEGCDITITIEKTKRKRSNPQNQFYWGVVVVLITNYIVDAGNVWTREDTHLCLRGMFLKTAVLVNESGECIERIRSTTELSTIEWEEYIEQIRAWAASSLGAIIPMPNEQIELFL